MKEEYNGFTIEYSEWNEKFVAKIGESEYSNSNLTKVRKHIDALDKKEFKRFTIISEGGRWSDGDWKTKTVTSIFGEGDRVYAWVVGSDGRRSKEQLTSLFLDTPENRRSATTILELEKQSTSINKQIGSIKEKMERAKIPAGVKLADGE
jgi:hypothetical protein